MRNDDAPPDRELPAHYQLTRFQLLFSGASLVAAFLCARGVGVSHCGTPARSRHWWVPLAAAGGMTAADFASGLVHWGADTWGRDDLPSSGSVLLVPFRVHHINPDDFLQRRFLDTNGDVASSAIPVLLAFLTVPLETLLGGRSRSSGSRSAGSA